MDLTLLYWVRSNNVKNVFPIAISREANVATLQKALKAENSATFRDVDARDLEVYPLLVRTDADCATALGKWRLNGREPLDTRQKLSQAFPETHDGEWVVVVNYPTARMEFRVYFKHKTFLVSAVAHDTVEDFLPGCLRDRQDVFGNISTSRIKVHRLNPPLLHTEEGKFLDNLVPMKGTDLVELSFGESTVTRWLVCMAFVLVEDVSSTAINALERRYTRIFSSLKITVAKPLKWTMNDVENNLGGGRYTEGGRSNVAEIEEIQDLLGSLRLYDEVMQESRDFEIAQEYGEDDGLFDKIFETLWGNEGTRLRVLNKREFTTFYNILRCWQEDARKVRDQKSSAFKAGNFASYFIQPPFFCDGGSDIKYETEMPWGFPIFVGTRGALDVWRKYRPKSDLMVSSQGHLIPFFVSEVISMKSEDDRFRMLLQAIAAARAGKILLKKTAERKFFVVAVYLNKNMIASRYIVMQTGQDNDEPTEEFRQGNAY
ncbi:hypothetical protein EDC04DRAFT_1270973 [Pisolithus marmoratus]|nr:hypothetical protein EDC04DRAFT_1270973 [Pisolithus marmoratus]